MIHALSWEPEIIYRNRTRRLQSRYVRTDRFVPCPAPDNDTDIKVRVCVQMTIVFPQESVGITKRRFQTETLPTVPN